jgi:hypothetical protein
MDLRMDFLAKGLSDNDTGLSDFVNVRQRSHEFMIPNPHNCRRRGSKFDMRVSAGWWTYSLPGYVTDFYFALYRTNAR